MPAVKSVRKTISRKPSRDELRVKIAKDVIAQLESRKYKASCGTWACNRKFGTLGEFEDKRWLIQEEGKAGGDIPPLCDYVNKSKTCSVCALGGIFLSILRVATDCSRVTKPTVDPEGVIFYDLDVSPLAKFFSKSQLRMIEFCFEGGEGYHYIHDEFSEEVAIRYFSSTRSANERMKKIMKNIVRNKGKFIPEQDLSDSDMEKIRAKQDQMNRFW